MLAPEARSSPLEIQLDNLDAIGSMGIDDNDLELVFNTSQSSEMCLMCLLGPDSPSGLLDGSLLRMITVYKCEHCHIVHLKNYTDCTFKAGLGKRCRKCDKRSI